MNHPTLADFEDFFWELHRRTPYDWQIRLASRVVEGSWPDAIDLPTGSGKTSCLDVAVFALACQASSPKSDRSSPRRIFFCVNRRVIVDEAHQRAVRIAGSIWNAERDPRSSPVLARTAAALRVVSGIASSIDPPLDVLELRGGIYRENRWARSATQPTIVCTTIDQLGSRLLFRGYGVSPNAAPIQAALIAYDSLVLLDEAHISSPFLQTLEFVKGYLDPQRWTKQHLGVRPMVVVPMTATPPKGVNKSDVIRLEQKDRDNPGLDNRLKASKPAKLLSVSDVIKSAVAEVDALSKDAPITVGIIVNRVATARAIYEELREKYPSVAIDLVIGSMRPIDRDRQAERLHSTVGPDRPKVAIATSFIVATQCLEVGADYDFDAMVTECASLDALRQRFGRLNRGGRAIDARAVILIDSQKVKKESQLDEEKPLDPIYGNALSRTWNWLTAHAEIIRVEPIGCTAPTPRRRPATQHLVEFRQIDFGIDQFRFTLEQHGDAGSIPMRLLAPSSLLDAPVMLPAYVDFWCQTSPRPTPDPEVSLFMHGPQAGEPDVQVCWRADLIEDDRLKRSDWCDVVGLLPPTAAECMTVPISRLRQWLTDNSENIDQGDLLGSREPAAAMDKSKKAKPKGKQRKPLDASRRGVLWRGARSELIHTLEDLLPGDTLVLPVSAAGWNELGHVPEENLKTIDVAETAFRKARDRSALRLHSSLKEKLPKLSAVDKLLQSVSDPENQPNLGELKELLRSAGLEIRSENTDDNKRHTAILDLVKMKFSREFYPDNCGVVLTSRDRLYQNKDWYPCLDEGEDDRSRTLRENPVRLTDHTQHVRDEVIRTLAALPLDEMSSTYRLAADLHDIGKADERFQAMLQRTDCTDAWLLAGTDSALLAKSDGMPQTRQQRKEAWKRAGLPDGFRHEMLSIQIIEHGKLLAENEIQRKLILHLIAAHHGYARPFAPIAMDPEPTQVTVNLVTLTGRNRSEIPSHRIDSRIPERFWELTRSYGWWGLPFLEAVLRLADQQASADEDAGAFDASSPTLEPVEAATR
jgi:CRISPR-associated endonuclease/helicase Cas3